MPDTRMNNRQIKRNKVSLGSKEEGRRDSWNIWEMEALRPDDWLSISHSVMSDSLQPFVTRQAPLSLGKNTGVGCHFLFQEIFLIWGLNLGFLHCRQILYRLSHLGSLMTDWIGWYMRDKSVEHFPWGWLPLAIRYTVHKDVLKWRIYKTCSHEPDLSRHSHCTQVSLPSAF